MTLLTVEGLEASYGPVRVLHGIDLTVERGEVVVLLGANGAGKTTTLRALCQLPGLSTSGRVDFDGRSLVGCRTEEVVRRGIAHVPQGRGTFPELSVEENLDAGAYLRRDRREVRQDIERWYDTFPRLADRRHQSAGTLSGGEQQMLAVARACLSRPQLLLLDEPSLGLAPLVIQHLFEIFAELNRSDGTTILVVEQNATLALSIATRAYVIESGQIVLTGPAAELHHDDGVRRAYLGF
ncbi:ATP-binding cassette domain-containing protein [Nocardioides sp. MAH-18]|uniref:ATP-binding cassette domain-containing protein n=1 Tax=Nocardioides agri TaxID=2682843 RepID=A0A6L6XNB0_9ACTN|nr:MULTISPECIES: ABC transporter ATP-binding protein [unclassified Nocardioides]MBA2953207.1 ABC transporter ATP-binding protein [Nocardioides sp. CGMCC 1.13656]MVQ48076.1 ATP-binding cassette domain-containing protein [Nocardioides sp. MAH-18]